MSQTLPRWYFILYSWVWDFILPHSHSLSNRTRQHKTAILINNHLLVEQRFCTIVQDWIIFYILFQHFIMWLIGTVWNVLFESNYFGMCLSQKSTLQFKCLGMLRFFSFFQISILCSPRVHFFDQKYSKNSNIVKYFYNLNNCFLFDYILKCSLFLWYNHYSSLQCHMILHKSLYYSDLMLRKHL